MRCAGVARAGRRAPVARADPAAEPSSKASQHDDHGGPLRAPSPHPLLVQTTCRSRPARLPDESSALRRGALARQAQDNLQSGLVARAVMVARHGSGCGQCWLKSYTGGEPLYRKATMRRNPAITWGNLKAISGRINDTEMFPQGFQVQFMTVVYCGSVLMRCRPSWLA